MAISRISGPVDLIALTAAVNTLINTLNTVGAIGEITISDNSTPLALTTQSTWYPIVSGWTKDQSAVNTTLDTTNGTITAGTRGVYTTMASISFSTSESANTLEFAIFKDGVIIPDHKVVTWIDSQTYPNSVTIVGIDSLIAGNVLDIRARCTTAADIDIVVSNANFSIFQTLVGAEHN